MREFRVGRTLAIGDSAHLRAGRGGGVGGRLRGNSVFIRIETGGLSEEVAVAGLGACLGMVKTSVSGVEIPIKWLFSSSSSSSLLLLLSGVEIPIK